MIPKMSNLAVPRSRKTAINSQVCSHEKIQKMHSSAVMQKCLKLAGPLSWNDTKMSKTHKSVITKRCEKVAGPQSYKNGKNSHVCCQGKMQKLHRSAVTQKCLKLAILLSWNDTKNAKSRRSAVKEKSQTIAGPG